MSLRQLVRKLTVSKRDIRDREIFYQEPAPKFKVGDRFMLVNYLAPRSCERGMIRSRHANSVRGEDYYTIICDDGTLREWVSEKEICHERKLL